MDTHDQVYRSKDGQFMADVRDAIWLQKGLFMTDRKYALEYTRRYLFLDDLHRWAIDEITQVNGGADGIVLMGEGSLCPQIVLITYSRPTDEEIRVQDAILAALGYTEASAYRTWLIKSANQSVAALSVYHSCLEAELHSLKAPHILSFGLFFGGLTGERGEVLDFHGSPALVTLPLTDMIEQKGTDVTAAKLEVWSHIKNLLSYTTPN